jgi:anaerobic magnesium-protoporphyrin IX monomethyl ester cyclase
VKKNGLDVMLIAPGDRMEIYQKLGEKHSAIENPVWTGLLASFLRKRGFSVGVVDQDARNLKAGDVAEIVEEMNPHLAAIVAYGHNPSAATQVMPAAEKIATAIKRLTPEIKIIIVGGHAAALPERTLEESDTDFVCTGEGAYTLAELTAALKSGETDFRKVRGLMFRYDYNGGVMKTPPAPNVVNLDEEMPGIAWDLMDMDLYRSHFWHCYGDLERKPYASIYTTLGCPYHCTFCCIQAPFKSGEEALGVKSSVNSYRFWSPKFVVDQIGHLVERYGVRNVKIADELFVLNMNHVNAICDLIIERGYKLNIWAYSRIDSVRGPETVEKMKRAGINWLCFGIESASERVREDALKGHYKDSDVFNVIKRVRDGGIYAIANYIMGLPEDDYDTMRQTLAEAMELNCEHTNFYSAMAYPGSELYNIAIREGWPLPAKWSGYSQHAKDTLPLPTRYLTGPQVLEFRDWAWKVVFTNPAFFTMIRSKFGEATVQAIQEEAAIDLVRDYVQK